MERVQRAQGRRLGLGLIAALLLVSSAAHAARFRGESRRLLDMRRQVWLEGETRVGQVEEDVHAGVALGARLRLLDFLAVRAEGAAQRVNPAYRDDYWVLDRDWVGLEGFRAFVAGEERRLRVGLALELGSPVRLYDDEWARLAAARPTAWALRSSLAVRLEEPSYWLQLQLVDEREGALPFTDADEPSCEPYPFCQQEPARQRRVVAAAALDVDDQRALALDLTYLPGVRDLVFGLGYTTAFRRSGSYANATVRTTYVTVRVGRSEDAWLVSAILRHEP